MDRELFLRLRDQETLRSMLLRDSRVITGIWI
jgi:hypothetical protein